MKNKKYIFNTILFLIIALVSVIALETISFFSLDEKDKSTSIDDYLSRNRNRFLEDINQQVKCSFTETTIGHATLGYVHRSKNFWPESCKEAAFVNNIGINTEEDLPLEKNEDEFNVLILGGSVAHQLGNYKISNNAYALEKMLNERFYPPKKKYFRVYNGAAGGWKMPNQLTMLLMYGERIDGAIAIEGYNEAFNVSSGVRLEVPIPAQFILSHLSRNSWRFSFLRLISQYKKIVSETFLSHFYSSKMGYKILIGIMQKIIIPPDLIEEFSKGNNEQLYLTREDARFWVLGSYERYIKNFHNIGQSNNILTAEFLQPTRLYGKELTETEKSFDHLINHHAYKLIDLLYQKLADERYNVKSLTAIFANEKETIYSDYIHYLNANNRSRGNDILINHILENLKVFWKLKEKKGANK